MQVQSHPLRLKTGLVHALVLAMIFLSEGPNRPLRNKNWKNRTVAESVGKHSLQDVEYGRSRLPGSGILILFYRDLIFISKYFEFEDLIRYQGMVGT